MTVTIRDAGPDDEARWRALWNGYLAFYGVTVAPDITDATWRRVFDPASAIFMRVAEVDGEVKGFTLSLTHEGTWVRTPDCYLEDLFVDESARGHGVGRALLDDLVASGLADRTLVIWMGEFGRTPQINIAGGRDHHPRPPAPR